MKRDIFLELVEGFELWPPSAKEKSHCYTQKRKPPN